jgi:hypothetical protein
MGGRSRAHPSASACYAVGKTNSAADPLSRGRNRRPAADVMKGMNGNDLLRARFLASDKLINCGVGKDKADLDKLPKDPSFKVKGCKRKTRH